jgi:putative transposase
MLPKYEYRRKLPHYQPDAKIFFITFCTSRRWVLPAVARAITLETCLRSHRRECDLDAVVVMPDHVHLLLTPLLKDGRTISIPEITQTLKSVSAHRINKALGRKGCVWQEESFDRALRREEAADAKILYMLENPVRAGLVDNPMDYRWLWRNTDGPERIGLPCTGEGARASTDKHVVE